MSVAAIGNSGLWRTRPHRNSRAEDTTANFVRWLHEAWKRSQLYGALGMPVLRWAAFREAHGDTEPNQTIHFPGPEMYVTMASHE
jgi:hypothetical protein